MTLVQWLHEAAGIFPAGVQARLALEYRAHLEDSVVEGGPGEAAELFGPPSMVRKHLESL